MTAPSIEGFKNIGTPAPWRLNRIEDTEDKAFKLGNVTPGQVTEDYNVDWFNMGYAELHDPRLTLIAHPTMDEGAAADTLDVMQIGERDAANHILAVLTPATPANTTSWDVTGQQAPLQDPFIPFEQVFMAGIKWSPPIGATPGWIRKAFQWDGSYNPDAWDLIYMPLADNRPPDTTYYDPWVKNDGGFTVSVTVDVTAPTGYTLKMETVIIGDSGYYEHNLSSRPWYSVDNAVGYYIKHRIKIDPATGPGFYYDFYAEDGTYTVKLIINKNGIDLVNVVGEPVSYAKDMTAGYVEIGIGVKGTEVIIYIDGVAQTAEVLNNPSSIKVVGFGIAPEDPGVIFANDIRYYLGGKTEPTG